jgi:N utilization substance protein B
MMSANKAGRKHASRNERSAARLAATQALYQIEMSESDAEEVLTEFIDHRLGGDPEVGLGMVCDENFFKDIVRGVLHHQTDIDSKLSASLASGWTLRRVDSILRALIDEYVELAKDFFDGEEPAFVNAVLDRLAREGRA